VWKLDDGCRPKRGEEGYDPAYKYDYMLDTLVKNTNYFTDQAEMDLTVDETSWSFGGFAEALAKLVFKVYGKPGVSRGGQIVCAIDRTRCRIRAYTHRHGCHPSFGKGWGAEGPSELRRLVDKLEKLVGFRTGHEDVKVFPEPLHITGDNYFSGDIIMNYLGERGFGALITCMRNRLPKGIKTFHLHKKPTDTSDVTKVARFLEPVVAIKVVKGKKILCCLFNKMFLSNSSVLFVVHYAGNGDKKPYMLQHVSMQSTSSCNFSCVNSLNLCEMSVRKKERGRGAHRRAWGIENNEARETYLSTYGGVDHLDHMIKNCNIYYRSWKYWHAARLHILAMFVCTAFDFYLECCEGQLDSEWEVEKPMSFWQFRMKLSTQLLTYHPKNGLYPGDKAFRVNTQRPKLTPHSSSKKRKRPQDSVTKAQYKEAKQGGKRARLCGDLTQFALHVSSYESHGKRVCVYCGGEGATAKCTICGVSLHRLTKRGQSKDCNFKHHSDVCFGLAREDNMQHLHKRDCDFVSPTKTKEKENASIIKSYMKK